jgi:mono/diheme cytochrome c family protein
LQKISGGHNGFPTTLATQIQSGIQAWATAIASSGSTDNQPPSVTITSPLSTDNLSGVITLAATATDNLSVAGVQFYVDGTATGAESTTAPYTTSISAGTLSVGPHVVMAIARDGSANTSPSAAVTFHVVPLADTTPPSVSVTAPLAAAVISGSVMVAITATDDTGVVGVQLMVDGVNSGSEDTTAPYAIPLNTVGLSNAAHTLTVKARDAAGNTKVSAAVSITVSNVAYAAATYTSIAANILVPKCVSCHGAVTAQKGVRWDSYAETIKNALAGNVFTSKLYIRTADGTMPAGGPPLSAAELKAINDWISNGALNN